MKDEDAKVGAKVILRKHTAVQGVTGRCSQNWTKKMDQYIEKEAVITKILEIGKVTGRLYVRVDIDNGEWGWRVYDMELVRSPVLNIKEKTKKINLLFDL